MTHLTPGKVTAQLENKRDNILWALTRRALTLQQENESLIRVQQLERREIDRVLKANESLGEKNQVLDDRSH